jgi:hypothetical protein
MKEHIMRILGEATEQLFPSDIAERLNRKLGPAEGNSTDLRMFFRNAVNSSATPLAKASCLPYESDRSQGAQLD